MLFFRNNKDKNRNVFVIECMKFSENCIWSKDNFLLIKLIEISIIKKEKAKCPLCLNSDRNLQKKINLKVHLN